METLLETTNLVKRAYWLVRLRWLAIAVLAAGTFIAGRFLKIQLPAPMLYLIAAGVLVYNFLLFDLLRYFTWGGKSASHKTIGRIITFQICGDLFILTAILHYSGGIENPFFLYFVFHMVLGSVFLTARQSYLHATLAVFLFGGLIVLEYLEVINHYALTGFATGVLYHSGLFVFGTLFVFSTTLYLVVYMTTSISTQLKKQQQEYERANIQLSQKDHLKNEYVLRLTHDIRGHLAAIQSCLNIVGDTIAGALNERQTDLINRACRRTAKCMAFVTALLKLTRMKLSGRLEMSYFSIKSPIFNALAVAETRAARKSINISCEIQPSVDEVYGEPVLIEEAIANLLFNAVRYTPEKGTVRLCAKDQPDCVLLEVSDTGIGIPENELTDIFEEFYRAGNAKKVERDGTGLGLSIARQVVQRHGGKIWARNNQNGGSTFSMTLPKISREPQDNQGSI